MINEQNLINDGLEINSDGSCFNNGDTVWSYNQGVILGGLVELSRATGDSGYLSEATSIAEAAIEALSEDGILHESCEPNDCGADGSQFKGERICPVYPSLRRATRADLTRTFRHIRSELAVLTTRGPKRQLPRFYSGQLGIHMEQRP